MIFRGSHPVGRTLFILCASALAKCFAAADTAAVCDPLLSERPALLDLKVDVPPGGHATRELPTGKELIIFARELVSCPADS